MLGLFVLLIIFGRLLSLYLVLKHESFFCDSSPKKCSGDLDPYVTPFLTELPEKSRMKDLNCHGITISGLPEVATSAHTNQQILKTAMAGKYWVRIPLERLDCILFQTFMIRMYIK